MKIYTRTGDDGSTSLLGGTRVQKDDLRLECYGTVDELNAHLGMISVLLGDTMLLRKVQSTLFDIGSVLAAEDPAQWNLPGADLTDIELLESNIDEMQSTLPELKNFVLPGGTDLAARCHVARCVCRRAERRLVTWSEETEIDPLMIKYLNRLSDWLFVLSRSVLHASGEQDVLWESRKGQ